MKNFRVIFLLIMMLPLAASAQIKLSAMSGLAINPFELNYSKENLVNESVFLNRSINDSIIPDAIFKPSVQVGGLMHTYFQLAQPTAAAGSPEEGEWHRSFSLYRARVLVGANISRKGTFFMETDIPNQIGIPGAGNSKNATVSPIILDFQYEHVFSNKFSMIVGKQLVSNNRNGLQGAASLMANDFTHYQYPYNMFEDSPLQGNYGRDIGVNTRGFFLADRLEYRLGVFTGRRFGEQSPYRVVGRLAYNFLTPEKDFYYAGTKLGTGNTLAIAGGVDAQSDYINLNVDGFLDVPVSPDGSVTLNAAFAYIDGGDEAGEKSFYSTIPKQTVQFLELGYYFKSLKLQPWIKYENQSISEDAAFYEVFNGPSGGTVDDSNLYNSNIRFGGGLNYFFNGYNTNVRLSYTQVYYGRLKEGSTTAVERASAGQLWLQLQVFFF